MSREDTKETVALLLLRIVALCDGIQHKVSRSFMVIHSPDTICRVIHDHPSQHGAEGAEVKQDETTAEGPTMLMALCGACGAAINSFEDEMKFMPPDTDMALWDEVLELREGSRAWERRLEEVEERETRLAQRERILQFCEDSSDDEDDSEDDSEDGADIGELETRLKSMEAVLSERERGLAAREAQFALDRAELHAMRALLLEEKQRIRDGRAGTEASTTKSAATTPTHGLGDGDAQAREFKLKAATLEELLQRQQEEHQEETEILAKERDIALEKLALYEEALEANLVLDKGRTAHDITQSSYVVTKEGGFDEANILNPLVEEDPALRRSASAELTALPDQGKTPSANETNRTWKGKSKVEKKLAKMAAIPSKRDNTITSGGSMVSSASFASLNSKSGSAYMASSYSMALYAANVNIKAGGKQSADLEVEQPSEKKRDDKAKKRERRELALKKHADRLAKTRAQKGGGVSKR